MPYGGYGRQYQQPISPFGALMSGVGSGISGGVDMILRQQQREQLKKEKQVLENKRYVNQVMEMIFEDNPTVRAITETEEGRNWLREIGADKNPVIAGVLEKTTPQPMPQMSFEMPSRQQMPPTGPQATPFGPGGGPMPPGGGGMPGALMPGLALQTPRPAEAPPVNFADVTGAMPSILDIAPEAKMQRIKEELGMFQAQEKIKSDIRAELEKDSRISPGEIAEKTRVFYDKIIGQFPEVAGGDAEVSINRTASGEWTVNVKPISGFTKEKYEETQKKVVKALKKAEDTAWSGLREEATKEYRKLENDLIKASTSTGKSLDPFSLEIQSLEETVGTKEFMKMKVESSNDVVDDYNRQIAKMGKSRGYSDNQIQELMLKKFTVEQFMKEEEGGGGTDLANLDDKIAVRKEKKEKKPEIRKGKIEERDGVRYITLSDGSEYAIETDEKGEYFLKDERKMRPKGGAKTFPIGV